MKVDNEIRFIIDSKGDGGDVATRFITEAEFVSVAPGTTWTVAAGLGNVDLPLYGYSVKASSPNLTSFSGEFGGNHVTYVKSQDYTYLRSREDPATIVSVRQIGTNGSAVAIPQSLPIAGNVENLHLFDGTRINRSFLPGGPKALELSARGHCNVIWKDSNTISITPNYTPNGDTVDVTYRGLKKVTLPQFLNVSFTEVDPAGYFNDFSANATFVNDVLTLTDCRPGWTYEFSW